ncbi:MAG: transporter, partial [Flavobacteriaceae bacterium]|nr:transporter [Flavobacteriaceae bacterium]
NSPTFFSVNLGISYRYDMHVDPEDNGTDAEDELEKKLNEEGKNRKDKKKNRKKKKKGAKIDSKRDNDIPDFDDDDK